jgi:hypothetical protein
MRKNKDLDQNVDSEKLILLYALKHIVSKCLLNGKQLPQLAEISIANYDGQQISST